VYSVSFALFNVDLGKSVPQTITVPDDYATIGQALAAASSGDTIFVKNGTYAESGLQVNKTLHLIGQNKSAVIVDGNGFPSAIFIITSGSGVTLEGFTVKNSWSSSIYVGSPGLANVKNNIIQGSNGKGVQLAQASNCILSENVITNCSIGISIESSSFTTIRGNNISQVKSYALDVLESNNVGMYHNNVFGGSTSFVGSQIACDNGYPSGGNFWFGYSGADSNGDGIGDTPYVPDPGNPASQDRYPLMSAFPLIHDLELENLWTETPVFGRGTMVSIELEIGNTGHFTEILNATIFANSTAILSVTGTSLESDDSYVGMLPWNTTEFSGGEYILWAQVEPVSGELYNLNNNYTYGLVRILDIQITQLFSCNQTGYPLSIFNRGSMAYFKVKITATDTFSSVVFTLNLYDQTLFPIGLSSFNGPLSMGNTTFILGVPLPIWAHIGTAKACANVFTNWPHQGGTPLCFENMTQFVIAREAGGGTLSQGAEVYSPTSNVLSGSSFSLGAEPLFESELSLSISTNKTSYFAKQGIRVDGQLMSNYSSMNARLVAIEVMDPAGETIITRTVQTQSDGNFSLCFGLPAITTLGNYTAKASFSQLGKVATADAIFELVTIVGDLNRDWVVDIFDIVIVAREFSHPPPPIVDPRADTNNDGIVDIFDIVIVAIHFGEAS